MRLITVFLAFTGICLATDLDVKTIIQRSVQANQRDYEAAPHYNNKERDHINTVKTFQVDMIDGSPYQRPLAINGKPLSPEQEAREEQKEAEVAKQRAAESPQDRQRRIAKFEHDRSQDNLMMSQLTEGFDFRLLGTKTVRGFSVYVLKATPRPGYKPPNTECEVLPGMQGMLWIDQKTFQWVKVTAQVIRPVSIGGFLAEVQPGTRFELEKSPVGDGSVWFVTHFSMRADARVLGIFSHNSHEDDMYWDYEPAKR